MSTQATCSACGHNLVRLPTESSQSFAWRVNNHHVACDDSPPTPPEPPTYEPKAGDTVTITLKPAEVAWASTKSVGLCGDKASVVWLESIASIVKVPDPLPTTLGSVIRDRSNALYVRAPQGWRGVVSGAIYGSLEEIDFAPVTVVFDAGKATP